MTIATAQAIFREGDEDRDGVLDYGTLSELASAGGPIGLIDPVLGTGTRYGYLFRCEPDPQDPGNRWSAMAWPREIGVTGSHFLYTDQTGEIYIFELVPKDR